MRGVGVIMQVSFQFHVHISLGPPVEVDYRRTAAGTLADGCASRTFYAI